MIGNMNEMNMRSFCLGAFSFWFRGIELGQGSVIECNDLKNVRQIQEFCAVSYTMFTLKPIWDFQSNESVSFLLWEPMVENKHVYSIVCFWFALQCTNQYKKCLEGLRANT